MMLVKYSIARKELFSLFLFCIFSFNSLAQEIQGIKYPGDKYEAKCGKCIQEIKSLPPEVQLSIRRDSDWNLIFSMSDYNYFDKLFSGSGDGVAVDIISKSQFDCGSENSLGKSWLNLGKLTRPIFLKEMKDNGVQLENGSFGIKIGKVPSSMRTMDIEYNLIIIRNKYFCYYNRFYDLARYRWDILDMGLFMDSLEYGIKYDSNVAVKDQASFMTSRMKLEIPFEKNKWTYKDSDLQPLYDSLRLQNFNIKRIEIRAYSSVEGSKEKNEELQNKRAESIVQVLQDKQLDRINQSISTSENWVEFYQDVLSTNYKNMADMSKEQIKIKLEDKNVLENLEPMLAKHRKAVIILDIERKSNLNNNKEELVREFQKAIREKNYERALDLQNSIFTKITERTFNPEVLGELEIPRQIDYGRLLNNQAAFNHFLFPSEILEAYKEFKELDVLIPNNKRIRYNLVVLKFRVWMYGLEDVDIEAYEKEINGLSKVGISSKLVRRIKVNLNIVLSEIYYFSGDYKNKDEKLDLINKEYRYLDFSDADLLSLAQYFASYARFDWATTLLLPYVKKVDVNEDLLFYYLNLTIVDDNMLKKDSYRNIVLNAISLNRNRFCKFFDPIEKGGASFQLLFNEKLKSLYCQDCQGKIL